MNQTGGRRGASPPSSANGRVAFATKSCCGGWPRAGPRAMMLVSRRGAAVAATPSPSPLKSVTLSTSIGWVSSVLARAGSCGQDLLLGETLLLLNGDVRHRKFGIFFELLWCTPAQCGRLQATWLGRFASCITMYSSCKNCFIMQRFWLKLGCCPSA